MYFTETTEPQPQPRPWATYRSWEPPSWELEPQASSWDLTSPWEPLLESTRIETQEEEPRETKGPRRRNPLQGLRLKSLRNLLRRLWPRTGGELRPHRI